MIILAIIGIYILLGIAVSAIVMMWAEYTGKQPTLWDALLWVFLYPYYFYKAMK